MAGATGIIASLWSYDFLCKTASVQRTECEGIECIMKACLQAPFASSVACNLTIKVRSFVCIQQSIEPSDLARAHHRFQYQEMKDLSDTGSIASSTQRPTIAPIRGLRSCGLSFFNILLEFLPLATN